MREIIISGQIFRVEIVQVLNLKDDGFSGVVLRSENGKLFRVPLEKITF